MLVEPCIYDSPGKKFFIDGLRSSVEALEAENQRLRAFATSKLGLSPEQLDDELARAFDEAEGKQASSSPSTNAGSKPASKPSGTVLALPGEKPSAVIDTGDFMLMQALTKAQVGCE